MSLHGRRIILFDVSFSGVNQHIIDQLRKHGWYVDVVPVPRLRRLWLYSILSTFRLSYRGWVNAAEKKFNRLNKTSYAFRLKSRWCRSVAKSRKGTYDLIMQISGTYSARPFPDGKDVPHVVLADYTMRLAEKTGKCMLPPSRDFSKWLELETDLYRYAFHVFVPSAYIKDSFKEDYEVDEENVTVIGYGTNLMPQPESKSRNPNSLLFIGKEFDRKGGPTILSAFQKARSVKGELTLTIVGPRFNPAPEMDGVIYRGRINDRTALEDIYNASSVFVIHSYSEPFGLVLLEAMSYRLACLGSDVDAMPEIILGSNCGKIVPFGDDQALADQFIELSENPAILKQLGENGYKKVLEYYNWDAVGERLANKLEEIIPGS